MKKCISLILILTILFLMTATGLAIEDPSVKVDTKEEIKFTKEELDQLPKELKKQIEKNKKDKMKIVDAVVTVYELAEVGENASEVISAKDFNFKNKENIKAYNDYIDELKNKEKNSLQEGEKSTLFDPVRGSHISVGLTVSSFFDPDNEVAYQAQGWWEWEEGVLGVFDPTYDTNGLVWTGSTTSNPATHNSFATRVISPGGNITMTKRAQINPNHDVLFEQTGAGVSTGATLAQITRDVANGEKFDIIYTYTHLNYRPSSSYWEYVITTFIGWVLKIPPTPPQSATPFVVRVTKTH